MMCFDRLVQRVIILGVCSYALVLTNPLPASAQSNVAANAAAGAVRDAAKKGFPLTSSSTDVTGHISVEAALIPAKIAKTVFGKEVADNYAVIALTISNRSSDDSFIVQTIFIDYSQWLLSGGDPWESTALCLQGEEDSKDAQSQQPAEQVQRQSKKCTGNRLQTWQQQTLANQIDSVEIRIVRGELLDRQSWTTRNWVLRALQGIGSIAAGFTFATTNQDWIRGIGAYNAHFIPAAQTFWPDATVGQMNRISDFGFQVNKVIAKQSSDIVVAFFPIERFLTPDLKSIFISSPAAFFDPLAAQLDPKTADRMKPYVCPIFPHGEIQNLFAHLHEVIIGACTRPTPSNPQPSATSTQPTPSQTQPPPAGTQVTSCDIQPPAASTPEQACQTAELIDRLSLNVVRVIAGGTMTVDVNKVPPQIREIEVDVPAGKDEGSVWVKGATVTGVIRGSFLGGATPAITNPENIQVAAVAKDSTDTELHFTITLKESLKPGTTLTFEVSKKSDGATIKSATRDYTIPQPKTGADTGEGATGVTPPAAAPAGTPTPPAPPKK